MREDWNESHYLLSRSQIRAGRVLAGLGVRDLAEAAGMSPGAISQIETGRTEQAHESTLRVLRAALEDNGVEFAPKGWVRHRGDTEVIHPRSQEARLLQAIARNSETARKNLGMTPDEVAEQIGESVAFYVRIELGADIPSVPTLLRLANALELSLDQLVDNASAFPELATGEGTHLDEVHARQLWRLLETATPSGVRVVTMILRELVRAQGEARGREPYE